MITQIKNKITQIEFTKMVASGNDFVVIETRSQPAPAKRSGPGKPEYSNQILVTGFYRTK